MKKQWRVLEVALIFVLALLMSACTSSKLAEGFNEDAVKAKAEEIISWLTEGDSETLLENCTVKMKDALTEDTLNKFYETIEEGGAFQEILSSSVAGTKDKASQEDYAVLVVKVKYENKNFTYTISLTKQMKVAGLYCR
jgi:hypothetical protein